MGENRERNGRSRAIPTSQLICLLGSVEGYYNLCNDDLQNLLVRLELLNEKRRFSRDVVASFVKYSFSISFLMMINAWQWFLAGILLGRHSYLPAQVQHLYYYSTFFSYRSFLAAHFKGRYTLHTEHLLNGQVPKELRTRRCVWLDLSDRLPRVEVRTASGREHDVTARWFYTVFSDWDLCHDYPGVESFVPEEHMRFIVNIRHRFTYQLEGIADELYHMPMTSAPPDNGILLSLWHGDADAAEIFPEEYWALEHLKLATELHLKLWDGSAESPCRPAQRLLVSGLRTQHGNTGLFEFLEAVVPGLFAS